MSREQKNIIKQYFFHLLFVINWLFVGIYLLPNNNRAYLVVSIDQGLYFWIQ